MDGSLLGRFLRDRRARITVEAAGLPPRRSGRSATLTQEDLAQLTGYSIRTISALEQGAEHRPTREPGPPSTSPALTQGSGRDYVGCAVTGSPQAATG